MTDRFQNKITIIKTNSSPCLTEKTRFFFSLFAALKKRESMDSRKEGGKEGSSCYATGGETVTLCWREISTEKKKQEFCFLKRYSVGGWSHVEPEESPAEPVAGQSDRAINGQPAFRPAQQQRRSAPPSSVTWVFSVVAISKCSSNQRTLRTNKTEKTLLTRLVKCAARREWSICGRGWDKSEGADLPLNRGRTRCWGRGWRHWCSYWLLSPDWLQRTDQPLVRDC